MFYHGIIFVIVSCMFCAIAFAVSECPMGYGSPRYVRLEYIESTGTQYIDTGIKGNMGYTYEFEFQQTDTGNYRLWGVFGQSSYVGFNISLTWSNGWMLRWNSTANGDAGIGSISPINKLKHSIQISDGKLTFDGIYKGRSSGHNSNYEFAYNLFLGTANPANHETTTNAHARFYNYKVLNKQGLVIQEFIPVKRNSDGAVGMYDTVTQRFFENAGTGNFIAGPEKPTEFMTSPYECVPCPPNTYKDFVGNEQCTPCLNGLVSPSGSKSADECGRVMYVDGNVYHLKSVKQTSPSLNIMDEHGNIFYGNLYLPE